MYDNKRVFRKLLSSHNFEFLQCTSHNSEDKQIAVAHGNETATTQLESESAITLNRNESATTQHSDGRESATAHHRTLSLLMYSTSTACLARVRRAAGSHYSACVVYSRLILSFDLILWFCIIILILYKGCAQ